MLVAFVNPSSQGPARAARAWSSMAGQSAYWPTRREMRARVEAAGFRDYIQGSWGPADRQVRLTPGAREPSSRLVGLRR